MPCTALVQPSSACCVCNQIEQLHTLSRDQQQDLSIAHRHQERERLAGAGLGGAQDVAPRQRVRDRGALDGGQRRVAGARQAALRRRRQRQLGKSPSGAKAAVPRAVASKTLIAGRRPSACTPSFKIRKCHCGERLLMME